MTSLRDIPCILMRGGTSRGPYFNAADLPADREQMADVLIKVMGSGSPLQVDGIGGGQATTSKAAVLSASPHDWAEIDYLFAQVHAEKPAVDFAPTCGNILAGVAPAALEMGMLKPSGDKTSVRVRNLNTGALVEVVVETPGGEVNYAGDAQIAGVPGSAAAVTLNFMEITGSKTGAMFPTGNARDEFCGVTVTCMDVAMPMVLARAADFGVSGYEGAAEIDGNADLFAQLEAVRRVAGAKMGLGEVAESVIPKFVLLAEPRAGGNISGRYFMPWKCHPAFAVSGAICTGACVLAGDTVAAKLGVAPQPNQPLSIEHPSGMIEVVFDCNDADGEFVVHSAGIMRTVRKLFSGVVSVPKD